MNKKGDMMFAFMPADTGVAVNQDVTLKGMSDKYSK